jgi:hypothetical protein
LHDARHQFAHWVVIPAHDAVGWIGDRIHSDEIKQYPFRND